MNKKRNDTSCPCGSGQPLVECCQPYISGIQPAPSAEALMRARFTAYAIRNEQCLLDSWHSSTRPESVDMDQKSQWIRLNILNSNTHHVEFVATYRVLGKAHKLYEYSRFSFEDGKWFYVDGHHRQNQ